MADETTFTGSQKELLQALVGKDNVRVFDEETSLKVMEFLDSKGATIKAVEDHSDSLEVRLGGPVFISVRKFVWGSAASILGLVAAIITADPKLIASAAQLVGSLVSSASIFPPDTTEFKVYSAIAALQKENPHRGPNVSEIGSWLHARGEVVTDKELGRGLDVLLDRQLLRRAGEDQWRIVW